MSYYLQSALPQGTLLTTTFRVGMGSLPIGLAGAISVLLRRSRRRRGHGAILPVCGAGLHYANSFRGRTGALGHGSRDGSPRTGSCIQ